MASAKPQKRRKPSGRKRPATRAKRCPKGKKPRVTTRGRPRQRKSRLTCVPKRKRRRGLRGPSAGAPVQSTPPAAAAPAPAPAPQPPADPGPPVPGVPVYSGPFGRAQAERLLWRAGFGPAPGQAEALASMGLANAVRSLTRPSGAEVLTGPQPRAAGDVPLEPLTGHGHDHLWWLDRMVRTNKPFIERMTLVWHDWFATANAGPVKSTYLMREQNEMLRRDGLGSFHQLLLNVTSDGAMLKWLNLWLSGKWMPDENYGREAMELFTLGADRGAYTENDVREMARALAGWTASRSNEIGFHDFRPQPTRQDRGTKTIFGQSGDFDWEDACRLCVEHPMHPSFLVGKLWGYFVPTAPDTATRQVLEQAYVAGSHGVRPIVEAILMHPDLYLGEPMVKPPVVLAAGLMRARGQGVNGAMLTWCETAGQRLFEPPNVDGWNDEAWLDTSTMRARWMLVQFVLNESPAAAQGYDPQESAAAAVSAALAFWGSPSFSQASRQKLEQWAASCLPPTSSPQQAAQARAHRQNALRQIVGASPDFQVC
jgi:Protein of unknown function (DUF1800)